MTSNSSQAVFTDGDVSLSPSAYSSKYSLIPSINAWRRVAVCADSVASGDLKHDAITRVIGLTSLHCSLIASLNDERTLLINQKWDRLNVINHLTILPSVTHSPVRNTDNVKYECLNASIDYADISIGAILKLLYAQKQISDSAYYASIRRVQEHKPLYADVVNKVNAVLRTIKASTSKSSLTALARQQDMRERVTLKANGAVYSVVLKKEGYSRLSSPYESVRMRGMSQLINDLKQKLIHSSDYAVLSRTETPQEPINVEVVKLPVSKRKLLIARYCALITSKDAPQ